MKVLVVGPFWFGGVTEYVKKAFEQLNCEVELFIADRTDKYFTERSIIKQLSRLSFFGDVDLFKKYLFKRINSKTRKILETEFVEKVQAFSPDLIFVIAGLTNLITSQSLKAIKRKTKIPLAIWCLDDPLQHYEITKSIVCYDHVFAVDPSFIQQLKLIASCPVKYLPGAADPDVYKPIDLSLEEKQRFDCDLAYLGSVEYRENGAGVLRAQVLQGLADFKMRIYGNPSWKKLLEDFPNLKKYLSGGYLMPPEVNKLYNAARIVVNIHRSQIRCGVNPKAYEIASAGAFQLIDKRDEIVNQFEIGKEIICYENVKELKELTKYYLDHSDERKLIAAKARQRVQAQHTYAHRMQEVIECVTKGKSS